MYITIAALYQPDMAVFYAYNIFMLLFVTTLQETVLMQSRFDQQSPLRVMIQRRNNTPIININLFHTQTGATQVRINIKLNTSIVTCVNKHARTHTVQTRETPDQRHEYHLL
jgi:hypothetical protein